MDVIYIKISGLQQYLQLFIVVLLVVIHRRYNIYIYIYIHIYIYIYIYEVHTMFPDFFRMGTFIDSTLMTL